LKGINIERTKCILGEKYVPNPLFESDTWKRVAGESLPVLQHDTVLRLVGIDASDLIKIFDYVK